MGNRLSKIYTRTGDDGSTGMADGSRVSKADLLFAVMGDVDELNSQIGLVRALLNDAQNNAALPERVFNDAENADEANRASFAQSLTIIQHLLFNIGGELAMPEYIGVTAAHITWLEQRIDAMNAHLPPLKDFILPTGSTLVSQLHVARSVCRRAERQAVRLKNSTPDAISNSALQFINRLSDFLFVAARFCTDSAQTSEVLWNNQVLSVFDDN
ncbi:cob(I)yrinic acid a,c-diamide adenosyltransferase [Psychrobacter ciconiae]|uniref:cob(I)yrinic acid a,c-diamide adenosyltransferase n=1 Tax=Psychrobacter ciconiae TaxID=1553449 RepID=UPI0019187565|nr:cob(I)yrinic acid a,c-diamide adenosyltransferase [Psychrobacter ciconiae]